MNDARIKMDELPARARKLGDEELQNVFGGCKGRGEMCSSHSECCSGDCPQADMGRAGPIGCS